MFLENIIFVKYLCQNYPNNKPSKSYYGVNSNSIFSRNNLIHSQILDTLEC